MTRRALAGFLAGPLLASPACSEPCCTVDSRPIPLERATSGELLAPISAGGVAAGSAVVDTGSPLTFWHTDAPSAPPRIERRTLAFLGPAAAAQTAPTRAIFRKVATVETRLTAIALPAGVTPPAAVLGGDLLKEFSVEIAFGTPAVTLWTRPPAPDSFLSASGFSVLHLPRFGGGELESRDPSDFLGESGPHQFPPSRLVLRVCAAPDVFDRQAALPDRCCSGDERSLATGTDLSLLLSTGVGPVVLARSAWLRINARMGTAPPVGTARPLALALAAQPLNAEWNHLPRLALVDQEADFSSDPGPCAELGRARRLEQVALRQSQNMALAACALPCDQDPRARERAQNSAAYVELDEEVEVAIIEDTEPLLDAVRKEVLPEGPQIDGFLGATSLARTHVELDYLGKNTRAIFSCEAAGADTRCRAVARCPRLPGRGQTRACFGLPAHGLPEMCDNLALKCGS
jgi:hypothetical protein